MSYRGPCGVPGFTENSDDKHRLTLSKSDFLRCPPINWIEEANNKGFTVTITVFDDIVYLHY